MIGPCLCGDPECGRCFPQPPRVTRYVMVTKYIVRYAEYWPPQIDSEWTTRLAAEERVAELNARMFKPSWHVEERSVIGEMR